MRARQFPLRGDVSGRLRQLLEKVIKQNRELLSLQFDADVIDSLQPFVRERIGHFTEVDAGFADSNASCGDGSLIEASPAVTFPDSFFVRED